jgi:hypothetical protein
MLHFYPLGTLLVFFIWLFFFLLQEKPQKIRMLKFSTVLSIVGPLSQIWFLHDYWGLAQTNLTLPTRVVFDLLFTFSIAGIGAVSLDTITKKENNLSTNLNIARLVFIFVVFFLWLIIFTNFLKMNSIYSNSIYLLLAGVLLALMMRALNSSLINGLSFAIATFIFYFVVESIFPGAIDSLKIQVRNFYLLSVPATELMWFFSAGVSSYAAFKYLFGK